MSNKFWVLVLVLLVLLNCRTVEFVSEAWATSTPLPSRTPRLPTSTLLPTTTSTSTRASTSLPTVVPTSTRRPATLTPRPTIRPVAPTTVPSTKLLPVHKIGLKPGMDIELAKPTKGQMYCQINHLEFVPNNRAQPDSFLWAQDKHWAYFYVRDGQGGDIRTEWPVIVTWADGSASVQNGGGLFDTWLESRAQDQSKNYTWIPSPGRYNGDWDMVHNRYGSYSGSVGGGVVSDIAVGLGVDDGGAPAANVIQWVCSQF